MLTTPTTVLALTLPAVLLAGCAGARAAEGTTQKRECILKGEINLVRSLDEKHVFVTLSANRNYLLSTDSRCPGLTLARKIEFFEATSRVCADGVSMLAFEEPAMGPMRCRIAKIEAVKDLATANELIHAEVPPKQ
jgi:Family of unknown function (DUF6491)